MSFGLLRSWLNRPASCRRRQSARKGMGVEQLEERQLMATNLAVPLAPALQLDFGTAKSPVAPGYTQVTPTTYSAAKGLGWQSTSGLTAINRNSGDPLTTDFHRGRNSTFLVDVPNGTYQVTALLGDTSNPLDRVNIVAEGRTAAANLSAPAGSTTQATFQTTVTDGQLNLRFNDRGGRNPYFTLAALNISAVNPAPTADAGMDILGEEGSVVSFSGTATGGDGLSYLWDFGDGTTATDTLTPTHTYRDSGFYTITLTVTDATGQSATDSLAHVSMNVAPSVTLPGPLQTAPGAPLTLSPTVTDPGIADVEAGFYYTWDFGDGSTSFEANPTHAYDAPGTYTVNLHVMDKDGKLTYAFTTVEVTQEASNFQVDAGPDRGGEEGTPVSFQGTATGDADGFSYLWDFGDGSSASGTLNPTHTYQDNGDYTVTLTVTDKDGQSSSDSALITISNAAPTSLAGGPYSGGVDAPIAFAGSASDPGQADVQAGFTYSWDFGDGTVSSEQNPNKTYAAAGTFTVRLTVTDKDGATATAQTTATINSVGGPLTANAGPDRGDNEGALVSFNGSASGGTGALSYNWDFGDGTTATGLATTSHTYQDNGQYTVTLTVTDAGGQSQADTAQLTIGNVAPSASVGGPYSGTAGQAVSFAASATDPSVADQSAGLSYSWDFGDGNSASGATVAHTYATAGTYTVQLTVTDKDGGATTVQTIAAIVPTGTPGELTAYAGPDQSTTEGQSVTFQGSATSAQQRPTGLTYQWNFGDGSSTSGTSTPSHIYQDNGTYTVTLTVTDGLGGSTQDTAVVTVGNADPSASAGGFYTGQLGTGITFTGTATDPGAADQASLSFSWNFGDGNSATGPTATHVYSDRGTYTVTLTVTDKDGGTATSFATASVTGPSQPAPTGEFITTTFDRIPNFGANPTITSVRSGNWSDPGTWSLGRLPVAGDIVSITGGKAVTYDVTSDAAIKTVAIQSGAQLSFRTDVNTRLIVTNLLVMEGGTLQIGTQVNPVAANVKAEVLFTDTALDLINDPEQYGNGLIALGKVTMHGAVKDQTFIRLAVEPRAGSTTLTLSAPATGWRVGDTLVLPDTRQLTSETGYANYNWQGENVSVAAISADGRTVTLTTPLAYDHLGARSPEGVLDFLPHVMNRSRNVVVRSQNATGVRGYTLFTERADVDIRYTTFAGLGRSTNEAPNNTLFDVDGNVSNVGTNQQGRYPVYFRHLTGPLTTPANGYNFTFVGNSVFCPVMDHHFKWPLTINDSNNGLVKDNVFYNWAGSGIVLESGKENYNVIEHNFVLRQRGIHGWNIMGMPNSNEIWDMSGAGTQQLAGGFWSMNGNNYVRDNVVANVMDSTYDLAGFVVIGRATGFGVKEPFLEFARNECYGATMNAYSLWDIGADGFNPFPNMVQSVVKDCNFWNVHGSGFFLYGIHSFLFDGTVGRGDLSLGGANSTTGMGGWEYLMSDITVSNWDVRGISQAWIASVTTAGTLTIKDSYFDCTNANIQIPNLYPRIAPDPERCGPRNIVIQNVRYGSLAASNIELQFNDQFGANLPQLDTIKVYSYDGVVGDDFQVFYYQQLPDYVMPKTIARDEYNQGLYGSPEEGLTNQQLWDKYRIAVGGALAVNTTRRTGIVGLVRDI